jgi:hypothetical protein
MNHFGWQLEGFHYPLSKNCSQKPLVDNHNDLFMHFLVMNPNGQVTTYGCKWTSSLLVRTYSHPHYYMLSTGHISLPIPIFPLPSHSFINNNIRPQSRDAIFGSLVLVFSYKWQSMGLAPNPDTTMLLQALKWTCLGTHSDPSSSTIIIVNHDEWSPQDLQFLTKSINLHFHYHSMSPSESFYK